VSTFEGRQPGLYPTALRGQWGAAWGGAFGAQKDDVVTRGKLAVKAGFVRLAPADALARHAADVVLPLLPGEADADLRARVAAAWDTWPWAGTSAGLSAAVTLLGYTNVEIRTARELGAALWAQWFVVAQDTLITSRPWGAPGVWGDGTWGSSASRDFVRRTRGYLRLMSNARDIGWVVISDSSPGIWGLGGWGTPAVWGGVVTRWRI